MRDIELAIQEHKQKVLELYPEHQILGIFYMVLKTIILQLKIAMLIQKQLSYQIYII